MSEEITAEEARRRLEDLTESTSARSAQARQGTLPFKRRSVGQRCHVPEEVVERGVDQVLTHAGAKVLSTVHRYRFSPCPRCGHRHRPTGGYGATPGVPDRLVRLPHWPRGMWLGIELKGTRTVLSDEQKRLLAAAAIVVCRSAEEALEALRAADAEQTLARQLPGE